MWKRPRTASAAAAGGERLLGVEITLRNVPPLDEIVFFVRDWTERLEQELTSAGRCSVTVEVFRQNDGRRCYQVAVRVVGPQAYAASEVQGTDLFHTMEDGFTAVHAQLRPDHSGVIRRAVLDRALPEGRAPEVACLGDRRG